MRRPLKTSPHKLSPDSQRLIALAEATNQASSRLERRVWEKSLDEFVLKLLKASRQTNIDAALEHLFKTELNAYDTLLETTEAVSESSILEQDEVKYDVLLIAAPILAWTRFSIASGSLPAEVQITLSEYLAANILSAEARMAMAPTLFSIEQLPYSHVDTFSLTKRLSQSALKGTAFRVVPNKQETVPFLADVRYLLAAVAVPSGAPVFRWQTLQNPAESGVAREECLVEWQKQATPSLVRLLPGCNIELLLPEAFFAACRKADLQIRPASIRAAIHYLTHTLEIQPSDLCAVIGGFGELAENDYVDEYRVGFMTRNDGRILYGIVWPIYGPEEAQQTLAADSPGRIPEDAVSGRKRDTPIEQILALLHESEVDCEKIHDERFPMDFCEDCGAPLFADRAGELVHAEMPEDAPQSGHFH